LLNLKPFAIGASPSACRTCEQVTTALRASKRSLCPQISQGVQLGQPLGMQAHWGCSKPQSGPAAAPQRESAGLETTGMTALMSRTECRCAAIRQRQCSATASFRDPFATSSWPREAHIHKNREGGGTGGAASLAHTRSGFQRAKPQGPSQAGNPPLRATAPAESHCGNKPNLRQTDTVNKTNTVSECTLDLVK
jgi:hypothetical protein